MHGKMIIELWTQVAFALACLVYLVKPVDRR